MIRHTPSQRSACLAGCAMALALAAAGTEARAQAFQGTGNVTIGIASISEGPNLTTINVESTEVVIDWTPDDTTGTDPIDFLPAAGIATFRDFGSPPPTSYTVLNRILPVDGGGNPVDRIVEFNGTVQSIIGNNPGGSLWFYSPTGIVVGATAVFNTGSLILTTDNIDIDGGLYGPLGEVRFRGPPGVNTSVVVQPGAQLEVSGPGAYLALVENGPVVAPVWTTPLSSSVPTVRTKSNSPPLIVMSTCSAARYAIWPLAWTVPPWITRGATIAR